MSKDDSQSVAIITLYSYSGKSETKNLIRSYGHTFISLENISAETLEPMCGVKVASNEAITFSWWATDKHMGIWFNIEPNYIKLFEKYNGRVSLSRRIDREQFEAIRNYLDRNDRYTLMSNCAKNCAAVWNLCACKSDHISVRGFQTPKALCNKLRSFGGFDNDRPLPNTADDIFFVSKGKTNYFEMEKKR